MRICGLGSGGLRLGARASTSAVPGLGRRATARGGPRGRGSSRRRDDDVSGTHFQLRAKPTSSYEEETDYDVEAPVAEQATAGSAVAAASTSEPDYASLGIKIGAAVAFGGLIDLTLGFEKAEAYFTGYILEQTLSVDNLFVFILLFDYFNVPEKGKDRVLSFGIYTAAVLRGVLILLGSELIEKFEPVLLVFAGILLYSAYNVLFADDDEGDEDLNDSAIVKFCKKFIDVSDDYDGDKFFTLQNGVKVATPLLLVLATVELSDLIFAVDSIPAVFGVTKDPFIVYTSNMFAIVGLRSLFGVVSSAMAKLQYLEKAVGTVLGFVGLKMVADFGGVHISNSQSLLTICAILGAGVGYSLVAGDAAAEGED